MVFYLHYILVIATYFCIWTHLTDSGFVPIFVYAIFGSSRQLAIGPVALVSLLVSNVLGGLVDPSEDLYTELAILLALMVGIMECIMGLLRYLNFMLDLTLLSHELDFGDPIPIIILLHWQVCMHKI